MLNLLKWCPFSFLEDLLAFELVDDPFHFSFVVSLLYTCLVVHQTSVLLQFLFLFLFLVDFKNVRYVWLECCLRVYIVEIVLGKFRTQSGLLVPYRIFFAEEKVILRNNLLALQESLVLILPRVCSSILHLHHHVSSFVGVISLGVDPCKMLLECINMILVRFIFRNDTRVPFDTGILKNVLHMSFRHIDGWVQSLLVELYFYLAAVCFLFKLVRYNPGMFKWLQFPFQLSTHW